MLKFNIVSKITHSIKYVSTIDIFIFKSNLHPIFRFGSALICSLKIAYDFNFLSVLR